MTKAVGPEMDAAARRLVAQYCHLVDDHNVDATLALFAPDARFRMGDSDLQGLDEIRGFLDSVPKGMLHSVSNVVVSSGSHPDTYHAVSDLQAWVSAEGSWTLVLVGRYHDTMAVDAGNLRFTQRIVTTR